jgi:hypothetical protein
MPTDSSEYLARKDYRRRFRVVSGFPARLRSHDRPVERVAGKVLPPDTPSTKFISKDR